MDSETHFQQLLKKKKIDNVLVVWILKLISNNYLRKK